MADPLRDIDKDVDRDFDSDETHKDIEKAQKLEKELEMRLAESKKNLVETYVQKSAKKIFDVFIDVLATRTIIDGLMNDGFRKHMINKLEGPIKHDLGMISIGLVIEEKTLQQNPEMLRTIIELKTSVDHFKRCVYDVFLPQYQKGFGSEGATGLVKYVTALYLRMADLFRNIEKDLSKKTKKVIERQTTIAKMSIDNNFKEIRRAI